MGGREVLRTNPEKFPLYHLLAGGMILLAFTLCGCGTPHPGKRTVQTYLMLLSGELDYSHEVLERVTTEHYRNTDHPHLHSLAEETRENSIDLASELKNDPSMVELINLFSWETTYEFYERSDTEMEIVARVIMVERREGNREKALEIENLPEPFRDVIEGGLELPFRFELKLEEDRWKIDDLTFPDILLPLLDLPDLVKSDE